MAATSDFSNLRMLQPLTTGCGKKLLPHLLLIFQSESKSISRGENHFKSNHIDSYSYMPGILRGKVQASMKKKVYNVTVSTKWPTFLIRRGYSSGTGSVSPFVIRPYDMRSYVLGHEGLANDGN